MNHLWIYNRDHRKRPNVHPLQTPSGVTLSRDAPEDHPWHHGLWFTIKFVNEENFWEEYDAYGVLRHVDADTVHWIRPDRETVVIVDHRTLTHVDLGADDAYGIDWDITLTPQVDVVLDRTEFTTWGGYGGLALRARGGLQRVSEPRDLVAGQAVVEPAQPVEDALGQPGRVLDLEAVQQRIVLLRAVGHAGELHGLHGHTSLPARSRASTR